MSADSAPGAALSRRLNSMGSKALYYDETAYGRWATTVTVYRQAPPIFGPSEAFLSFEVHKDGERVLVGPETIGEDDHPDGQQWFPASRVFAWADEILGQGPLASLPVLPEPEPDEEEGW